MDYSTKELFVIWLDSFTELEYKYKLQIYNEFSGEKDINSFLLNTKDYLVSQIGQEKYSALLGAANNAYVQHVINNLNKKGIICVTLASEGYPKRLAHIFNPPLVLYARGRIELLNSTRTISIVGSRKSLPISRGIATDFTNNLAKAQMVVVTGCAEGIDQTALETARANRYPIISVIAGGHDNVYPASNRELINDISEFGLVISESEPSIAPKPYMFPIRNRIIAALGDGVVIVSAGIKSGTMYTADYAEEFGKQVFALPYSVGVASGAGCNELIKRGAMLCDSAKDVLDFFGVEQEKKALCLSPEEKRIIEVLADGQMHVDYICRETGKKIFEISPLLSIMEIKGLVCKNGSNVYGLKSNSEE